MTPELIELEYMHLNLDKSEDDNRDGAILEDEEFDSWVNEVTGGDMKPTDHANEWEEIPYEEG